jgi:hypothetical protein
VLLFLGFSVWWGSYYLLAPLFFPFSAYAFSGGQWTNFSERNLGWEINVAYGVLLALGATWFGRRLNFGRAAAVFGLVALGASLVIHAVMAALGFNYWYDTP